MRNEEPQTPLPNLLRALDKEQRETLATQAGTSVGYLYQLATCVRGCPRTNLALAIEDASKALAGKLGTPVVTARELADMCVVKG